MKILTFADMHGDMQAIEKLRKKSHEVDVAVCAGDLTTMESNLIPVLKALDNFSCPVLIIHGNHEDNDRLERNIEDFDNLIFFHRAIHELEHVSFVGYGGGGFALEDKEFERVAQHFFKPHLKTARKIMFVTHGPPHGTKIDLVDSGFKGNKSYRSFIDEVQPHVVVAGHLHELAGKYEKIGKTLILNPGKVGAIVEL